MTQKRKKKLELKTHLFVSKTIIIASLSAVKLLVGQKTMELGNCLPFASAAVDGKGHKSFRGENYGLCETRKNSLETENWNVLRDKSGPKCFSGAAPVVAHLLLL